MEGYFRFSKYLRSKEDLKTWIQWFNSRMILWFIEKKLFKERPDLVRFQFALWIKGKEFVGPGTKVKNKDIPEAIIEKSGQGSK